MAADVSIIAALFAGLLSFLSPCVLPLVPPYLVYLAGATIEHVATGEAPASSRRAVMLSALAFVCGFSTVFVTLGATALAAVHGSRISITQARTRKLANAQGNADRRDLSSVGDPARAGPRCARCASRDSRRRSRTRRANGGRDEGLTSRASSDALQKNEVNADFA